MMPTLFPSKDRSLLRAGLLCFAIAALLLWVVARCSGATNLPSVKSLPAPPPPRVVTNVAVWDPAPASLGVTNNIIYLGSQWGVVTQRLNLGMATNYVLGTNWSTNHPAPRSLAVAYQSTNGFVGPSNLLNWAFPVTNTYNVYWQWSVDLSNWNTDWNPVRTFTNVELSGFAGPQHQWNRLLIMPPTELGGLRPP